MVKLYGSALLFVVFALACAKPVATPAPEPTPKAAVSMDAIAPMPSRDLVPAGDISDGSRLYLARRMRDHGQTTTDLLFAVILLDNAGTQRIADRMAAVPSPGPHDAGNEERLEGEFPETFFDLEAELRASATRLSAAAAEGDASAVAVQYSDLVGTCVDCHALFTRRATDR